MIGVLETVFARRKRRGAFSHHHNKHVCQVASCLLLAGCVEIRSRRGAPCHV